ncbi:MAG TPA: hypothetical protein VJ731_15035 [Terriglobales bacterium]|nr:hypothetical protein [Terriglobales bacterium]
MDCATRIRKILAARQLNLYRVSQMSAELFGSSSEFYVPHNLYSALARRPSGLSIYQAFALSRITGYRFVDWLRMLGFDVDAILQLSLSVRPRTTMLLDAEIYDSRAWVPWWSERIVEQAVPRIAPLGQLLSPAPAVRAESLLGLNPGRFFYAIIGETDAYCRREFAPGTIVRADAQRSGELPASRGRPDGPFFLIEHDSGWTCSRVIASRERRFLLHNPEQACVGPELPVGKGARILGAVDAEIRPIGARAAGGSIGEVACSRGKVRKSPAIRNPTFGDVLREYRAKAALSFREASALSRRIARQFNDELYFTAASTLSDYETLSRPPRQIQKVLTVCVLYGIRFDRMLLASALSPAQTGQEPMPDEFAGREEPFRPLPPDSGAIAESAQERPRLPAILQEWEEMPFFLSHRLDEITGIKNTNLKDLFWVGGERPRHPLLNNARIVAVNRRTRKLANLRKRTCHVALQMLLLRDGSYLCGCCTREGGNLVMHGYPLEEIGEQRFRNGIDAEVVGQVTAILRRLP